ncbi:oxidation resistance protein 1-like isoform X3 [Acipenser ruthenus]|uniref:oxidation resistance protein 1-like isoform X3 n=1 Tax=Acipenser ruthenus TaxID=7906 RepID=UPI00145A2974|nr:oxidation resistance protein 1-like isoform X3 [Acipenser ruthenus]
MEYLLSFTGKSARTLREIVFNRSYPGTREIQFKGSLTKDENVETADHNTTVQQLTDTGQKKTPEKKDGRRMSFQKPKGTIEYSVESRDSLNNIALKFDTTPNELVQLNKLFSRAVVAGQILYVPDPEYISSVESSPSLSPISPLSPTSSEAELEKVTVSDGVPRKEATSFPAHVCTRPARVVSSTSEEEEALTEKFLKINCKYITDGKGTVSGVLLVTPNNIMFDPHKTDPLVQEHGCEEYGIMCPIEEVMTATMYKDIVDTEIKESLPPDLEYLISGREPCHVKRISRSNTDEMELKLQETANDSTSTAPRSTEESLSEDVFTESELSPIREELVSSDELRQDKSSGASSESVQTINQTGAECCLAYEAGDSTKSTAEEVSANDSGFLSHTTEVERSELELKQEENLSQSQTIDRSPAGSKRHGVGHKTGTSTSKEQDSACEDDAATECKVSDSQCSKNKEEAEKGKFIRERTRDSETEVEELRKLWKSHTMQQTKEQRDNVQQTHIEVKHRPGEAVEGQGPGEVGQAAEHIPLNITSRNLGSTGTAYQINAISPGTAVYKEKRRHRSHKFLCLRVGKPMRKTFVSQASASMQQYAQRDRKHEYWFAVPQERTDHLYAFFIQWSPDMYGEGAGVLGREPGFMVVKRNEESETGEEPASEVTAKDWEVVSVAEYHRRIDALNTEELRSLCKRLKITTKEDVNSKQGPAIKTDLEPDTFRPNLSEPSELLQPGQIEKLAKHLPPRTIGYPWTLAFSTARNGMSIKTLYRTMQGQDTPVLMVLKDSDGQVFGALASEPFKVSDCFYGTGETFLFTFCPEFEVFKWTGDNMFFIKGDMDSLAFGGGGGEFGLWLDGDLYHGRSHSCKTFGNHTLSKKEDFYVQDIEIWSFE